MPTSIVLPLEANDWSRRHFVSLLNSEHPGNRIGYRFIEHEPLAYGKAPAAGERDKKMTSRAEKLEKKFAARPGVHRKEIHVTDKNWVSQEWVFYLVPLDDGFDMLWVVETAGEGLSEYYASQQCFRMSGDTNKGWRRRIADTHAFSEYDRWAVQQFVGNPFESNSFVRQDNEWDALRPVKNHIGRRTPHGLDMDNARTNGNLAEITEIPEYGPTTFGADIDSGLATRVDVTGKWVCALYWERTTHITDHHPADCLHAIVNLGPMPPYSKRAIRGRIYWMKASKDELFEQWDKEFGP